MGGEVAFAIKKNGRLATKEFSKYAATNITRVDFFAGKGGLWKEWEKDPRVEVFAPIDYGLVVVDFDAKWVGGIQNYTGLTSRYIYLSDEDEIKNLKALWKMGRVESIQGDRGVSPSPFPSEEKFQSWLDKQKKLSRAGCGPISIKAEISPPTGWQVVDFEKDAKGWAEFVACLVERGFDISDKDVPAWERFLGDKGLPLEIIASAVAHKTSEMLDANTTQVTMDKPRSRI